MATDIQTRIDELQTLINARNAAISSRVDFFMQEIGETNFSDIQGLTEERNQLLQAIHQNKGETDAMVEQLSKNADAVSLFPLAARLWRLEDFVTRAADYVQNELPSEIQRKIEAEREQVDPQVYKLVSELQAKREEELRAIDALQQRSTKRATEIRNGPRTEHGELGAQSRVAKPKKEEIDTKTLETKIYTDQAKCKKKSLIESVKSLRLEHSKLQAELLDGKHKNEKIVADLKAEIRRAELSHTRDTRMCQQLNAANAALTTNAQILLGQLNVEHYGVSGAPEGQSLITMLKCSGAKRASGDATNNNNNIDGELHNGQRSSNAWKELCLEKMEGSNGDGLQSGTLSKREASKEQPQGSLEHVNSQRDCDAAVCGDVDKNCQSAVVTSVSPDAANQQMYVVENAVPHSNPEAATQEKKE